MVISPASGVARGLSATAAGVANGLSPMPRSTGVGSGLSVGAAVGSGVGVGGGSGVLVGAAVGTAVGATVGSGVGSLPPHAANKRMITSSAAMFRKRDFIVKVCIGLSTFPFVVKTLLLSSVL
jgi:hypothetical protein